MDPICCIQFIHAMAGLRPSTVTFAALLSCCEKAALPPRTGALQLLRRAHRTAVRLNAVAYNAVRRCGMGRAIKNG